MSANLQEQIVTRPILFSGPMVRAILDGRKTQTRRIVKAKDSDSSRCITLPMLMKNVNEWRLQDGRWFGIDGYDTLVFCDCPYGHVGDRLWVRENWRECGSGQRQDGKIPSTPVPVVYAADDDAEGPWRPSIFMPRWASRITLELVSIRIERLREISHEDATAEGIERSGKGWKDYGGNTQQWMSPATSFQTLWMSINGHENWSANPWVWVVGFKVASNC